jgi:DNA modification methylase
MAGTPKALDGLVGRVHAGDSLELMRGMPDRCVDLVVLDPPYWKVVGEKWDYQWRTIEDYAAWCRLWLREVERVCKRSASLYLFGYLRNLVHIFRDVCDAGFDFRQDIVIDKGMKSVAGRKTSTYKQFPNVTETILFFVYDAKPAIRELLNERKRAAGLTSKEINERLRVKAEGGGMWSIYAGRNILAQVPTAEMWARLEEVLEFRAPEDLRDFHFKTQMGLTNVWSDISFSERGRIHPTQKPLPLVERILRASSRPGDIVLDPFAGSGTTAAAAVRLGRRCVSFEIDPEIAAKANLRLGAVPSVSEPCARWD